MSDRPIDSRNESVPSSDAAVIASDRELPGVGNGSPSAVPEPHAGSSEVAGRGGRAAAITVLIVALLLACIIGVAASRAGSLKAGFAYLAGHRVFAAPRVLQVSGGGAESEALVFRNLSDRPVRVVGYNATCSCVRVAGLPATIAPRGSAQLDVRAVSSESLEVPTVFLTDNADDARIAIRVNVVAPAR